MVKKCTQPTKYQCGICFTVYDSKIEAEECEKKKPEKIKMRLQYSGEKSIEWKIGDVLFIWQHDNDNELVRIVGEEPGYNPHEIWPIFEHLSTGKKEVFNDWDQGILTTKDIKRRILQWSKAINEE